MDITNFESKMKAFCMLIVANSVSGHFLACIFFYQQRVQRPGFITTLINVLCSNCVKLGRVEICYVMRCLSKKENLPVSPAATRYGVARAQNLPGQPPTMYS